MADFNYQKAYFTQAVPSFMGLNAAQKNAFSVVSDLTKDLQQDRQLLIPMPEEVQAVLSALTCQELAELARASYFTGHWQPSHTEPLFDNSMGQSWKVANCCDQVLRDKLGRTHKIEIHEGKLRVTFSSKDCWTWEEFGLATEKNLEIFKTCGLPFGESALYESAQKLISMCGDLWGSVDAEPENDMYKAWLQRESEARIERVHAQYRDKLAKADQDKADALKELELQLLCLKHNIGIDNLIYYSHKDTFTFGWRKPVSHAEAQKITAALSGSSFKYEIKEV